MNQEHRKRRVTMTVALVAAAAGGLAGWYYYTGRARTAAEIQMVSIARGNVVESVGASGTLEAMSTLLVGTQVTGRILELHADFNSIVRKGQLLARLDPSLYEAQVEQARANLVSAEANVERLRVALADTDTKLGRARDLAARSLIAQTELDAAEVNHRSAASQVKSAEAQVVQARASLSQAALNLEKTTIFSPIDGIVISREVDVGQTVSASTQAPTLFRLAADLTRMRVSASVDESDIGRLRAGQTATFRVDAFPDRDFTGQVTQVRLQPVVEQNVVTYAVLVDVPNPELMLRPGMTTNVTFEVARHDNVLRVPNAALRFRPTDEVFALLGQAPPDAAGDAGGLAAQRNPSLRHASLKGTAGAADAVGARGTSGADTGSGVAVSLALASTVDQIFEPIAPAETAGRLWVVRDGLLTAVPVRLGLTDGLYTEVRGADLDEGAEVVASVSEAAAARTTSTAATANPLLPQQPRMPGGGFGR